MVNVEHGNLQQNIDKSLMLLFLMDVPSMRVSRRGQGERHLSVKICVQTCPGFTVLFLTSAYGFGIQSQWSSICFKPLAPKSVKIYIYLVVHILYKGVGQLEKKQDLLISLPHVIEHLFFFCCFGIPLSSSAEVTQRPNVFWDTLQSTYKGILEDCPFHIFWQTATRCLVVRFAWSDNVISCKFKGCSYSGGSDYHAGCHLLNDQETTALPPQPHPQTVGCSRGEEVFN